MKLPAFVTALLTCASSLSGQGTVRAQLKDRVSPDVANAVTQLAESASASRLPVQPLIDKALEGAAKGVPGDRIVVAVRTVVQRLNSSAGAIRASGRMADSTAVEAGAFALSAGLAPQQVEALAHANRASDGVAPSLRVAGTLAALGVPADQTVALVTRALSNGHGSASLYDLPHQVQDAVSQGASPAQAAAGLNPGRGQSGATPGAGPPSGGVAPGQSGQPHGNAANPGTGHSHKP